MPTTLERRAAAFRVFAWSFLAYCVGVILWGAYVRATGSGAGCGSHWPTCDGEVIPRSFTEAKIVELTHRVTSGLAWLGALVAVIWARRAFAKGHRARGAAWLVLVFMTTEALVGAGVVLLEMVADNASTARAGWMAAHLVNTFLLLFALARLAWAASGGGALRLRGQGAAAYWLVAALAGVVVLGSSGAVAALGDTLFPSRTLAEALAQDFSSAAHVFVRLRVLHPLIGLLVGGAVLFGAGIAATSRRERRVRVLAAAAAALFVAQVALGFVNVALLAPVWMQIVHLLFADLVWLSLVLLASAALEAPRAEGAARAIAHSTETPSTSTPLADSSSATSAASRSASARA